MFLQLPGGLLLLHYSGRSHVLRGSIVRLVITTQGRHASSELGHKERKKNYVFSFIDFFSLGFITVTLFVCNGEISILSQATFQLGSLLFAQVYIGIVSSSNLENSIIYICMDAFAMSFA